MNIVFDLDGTLVDSAPDIQFVASTILSDQGKAGLTIDETRRFIGEGGAVFVSRMMAARDIQETPRSHAQFYKDFVARYASAVDRAVFYPGVLDALGALQTAGHRLGLCTNKPEVPTRSVLNHMQLGPFFDTVMTGGMLDKLKPHPGMLIKVIEDLGGGQTLYVGDSEIDSETARRADIPFALYTQGYRKSPIEEIHYDWAFDHFDTLTTIVGQAS